MNSLSTDQQTTTYGPGRSSAVGKVRLRGNGVAAAAVFLLALATLGADTPDSAVRKVQQGLQYFRNSQYAEAETAFADAAELDAENAVIIFDHACAAMANGDYEQARGLFRKAAAKKDPQLAVKANYNLGCLEATEARKKLGDAPVDASPEIREESVGLLLAAVGHYRRVLRIDREHRAARHNLELIRQYIKHIQSKWAERDKQKARDEKNLLQFLQMIEDRQTQLRSVARLLDSEDDSVQKRQALVDTADSQTSLDEEIEPLKQKIVQEFQAAAQNAASAPAAPDDDQSQQAQELLLKLADEAGRQMLAAAEALQTKDTSACVSAQTESLYALNQLYMAVVPYQNLLQRTIEQQQDVLPPEEPSGGPAKEVAAESSAADDATQAEDAAHAVSSEANPSPGSVPSEQSAETRADDEVSEQQSRISDWLQVLPLKAEQALPSVKQQLESLPPPAPDTEPASGSAPKPDQDPSDSETKAAGDSEDQVTAPDAAEPESDDAESNEAEQAQQQQLQQQRQQLEGLLKSMQLAVELAPEAEDHSRQAEQQLDSAKRDAAVTEQRETLRILKQIAEPLVTDPPSDQQNDSQQNNDQQNQQDEQQNQDGNQEQDQPKSDESPSSEDQNQESQDQQSQPQQPPEEEARKQRAENVLRQAREREQEHRELQKQLRAILGQRIKVDKDW